MSNPAPAYDPADRGHAAGPHSGLDLSDTVRTYRMALANEYHRRTGSYFAARFY